MPAQQRPLPRLRTKTGCFKCRLRRKKCDEAHPLCGGCLRQNLECIYPPSGRAAPTSMRTRSNANSTRPSNSNNSPVSEPMVGALPPQSTRGSQHSLLMLSSSSFTPIVEQPMDQTSLSEDWILYHFETVFAPTLLSPHAHPVYQDQSYLYSLRSSAAWVKSVYLANGALHASWKIPHLRPLAIGYYSQAVTGLQRAINTAELDGSEDSALAAIIFLYLYEKSHTESTSLAATHLSGMARLLRIRSKKLGSTCRTRFLPFYRVATESFIYQIAILSLQNPDIRAVSSLFSWADLEPTLSAKILPGPLEDIAAPLLGCHYKLYHLIFEVSRLCGQTPVSDGRRRQARIYHEKLDKFRTELEESQQLQASNRRDDAEYRNETRLYILATQILTFKMINPCASITQPQIQEYSDNALTLFRQGKMSARYCDFFCWPAMILGYTVTRDEDVDFLKSKFIELWEASFCGQIRRSAMLIKEVWRIRREQSESTPASGILPTKINDPLDTLVGLVNTDNHPHFLPSVGP